VSKKFVVPSEAKGKGLPPGVGSSKAPKGGFVVPSEVGKRGKPGKAHFPGDKPARD
jgi:hypothetical protein